MTTPNLLTFSRNPPTRGTRPTGAIRVAAWTTPNLLTFSRNPPNRFDFILVSDFIRNGTQRVRCLPDTYFALGQDGNRRNGSIIDPTNTAVPANIANALYGMSDHLPVIMDYQIDATLGLHSADLLLPVQVVNPVNDQLHIFTHFSQNEEITIHITTLNGQLLYSEQRSAGDEEAVLPFLFAPAMYLVSITDSQGRKVVKKVVKL